jgi:hypothetical protein
MGQQIGDLLEHAFEQLSDGLGPVPTCSGMSKQWDAVRTGCVDRIWERSQRGGDDIRFPQHGRREQVNTRAVMEQVFCNVLASHVGGGAECGLEVAVTPVPTGIDQPGLLCEQLFDTVQVTMSITNKLLNEAGFQSWF